MNTMKMKNGSHYKIQKSQDGGGDNAHKIFTSQVEEGYVPNTTSYVEMFMNTMKIKKIISATDTNIKCKRAEMDEGIMPIISLQARWRRELVQTLSYMELFMTPMKMQNNFFN